MVLAEKTDLSELGDRQIFCVMFADIFQDKLELVHVFGLQLGARALFLPIGKENSDHPEKERLQDQLLAGGGAFVYAVYGVKNLYQFGICRMIPADMAGEKQVLSRHRRQVTDRADIGRICAQEVHVKYICF